MVSCQGYHPELVGAWLADKLKMLRQLAEDPACVAIGECGLDFLSGRDGADKQIELFKLQVSMLMFKLKP